MLTRQSLLPRLDPHAGRPHSGAALPTLRLGTFEFDVVYVEILPSSFDINVAADAH